MYLNSTRPELKARLFEIPVSDTVKEGEREQPKWYKLDGSSAEKVIGMKEYKSWESIVDETIDDVLKRKKELGVSAA